jgi:hypothetical protein
MQRGGRRKDLDDQLRVGDIAPGRINRRAGHRKIELVEAVVAVSQPNSELANRPAGRPQPGAQFRAQIDHDRGMRLARRSHGCDPTVHQLVAAIGVVVPGKELLDRPALLGRLRHRSLLGTPSSLYDRRHRREDQARLAAARLLAARGGLGSADVRGGRR